MADDMEKTAIGVMDPSTGSGDEATQVVSTPQAEATQYAANVDCPVCHTPNPPSETYCIDCGFMLSSEPVEVGEMPETPQVGSLATPDGTREFALKPGGNTVGRQDADVLLSHNTVSRKHATITVEDGKVLVEDVGSTNGTTVAGKKLEPGENVEIADGAEVVFGSQALVFHKGAVEPEPPTDEHGCTRIEGEREAPAEPEPSTDEHGSARTEPEGVDSGQWTVDSEPGVVEEVVDDAEGSLPQPPTPNSQPPVGRMVSSDGSLTFDLAEGTHSVGRREGNDIIVPDPYCSGSHAELKVEGGEFVITDVGSTNGTLVNGVKLEPDSPRVLQPGDEVTIGNTVLKIEAVQ